MGVGTSRDAWVFNFSKSKLLDNMEKTINFYNEQVIGYKSAQLIDNKVKIEDFIDKDHSNISWSSSLIPKVEKVLRLNLKKTSPSKQCIALFAQ